MGTNQSSEREKRRRRRGCCAPLTPLLGPPSVSGEESRGGDAAITLSSHRDSTAG